MEQLFPWLPLALLLAGPVPQEPSASPARERVERHLTLPQPGAEEGVPEVRVATGTTTYLRFDAPIERGSVEVEGRKERFHLVDVGEQLIALEPSLAPGPGERLGLKVRYRDGGSPGQAAFSLVSHDSQVDGEVKVARLLRSPEELEARLARCEAGGPVALVFSGGLDLEGVQATRIEVFTGVQDGLLVPAGISYRAGRWALAAVRVLNLPGQKSWEPGTARLSRPDGTRVKVIAVHVDRDSLAPGEEGLVVVETEAPSWHAGQVFRLELFDKSGSRRLFISRVML